MANHGPWVVLAGMVDEADIAPDGGIIAVRFFDQVICHVDQQWDRVSNAILALRLCCEVPGRHTVEVKASLKDVDLGLIAEMIINEDKPFGIASATAPLGIPVDKPGTMWFSVFVNGSLAARFPIIIRHVMGPVR